MHNAQFQPLQHHQVYGVGTTAGIIALDSSLSGKGCGPHGYTYPKLYIYSHLPFLRPIPTYGFLLHFLDQLP
jgi:hypothetical protein